MEKFMNTLRGGLHDDEQVCSANKDKSSCDSDSTGCSWCVCSAVPSACHSVANAKKLPQSVFQCDNIGEEKVLGEKIEEPTFTYGKFGGKHGKHGKHEKKEEFKNHRCKKCCKIMHAILIAGLLAHIYLISKLADAQEAVEKLNGTYTDRKWHCSMFKELKQ
jgi:hypothetical protein